MILLSGEVGDLSLESGFSDTTRSLRLSELSDGRVLLCTGIIALVSPLVLALLQTIQGALTRLIVAHPQRQTHSVVGGLIHVMYPSDEDDDWPSGDDHA